ncbi:DUF4007 family protein [Cytobacillus gottheilii]|uniref:DUF4007 family protein n=1 Tax=Cytobacillus gottheilii TaxID=859144 RepID=UPI002494DCF1|nr:DUF4007 family protein [Cytobacillus gottheilii]
MNYKIQALNGFKMYFDQISNVFKTRYDAPEDFNLDQLATLTGLNRRKARLILNFLSDLGLNQKFSLKKTVLGMVIYKNDEFFNDIGTLWFLHYLQSINSYMIIWNRTLNYLYEISEVSKGELISIFSFLEGEISDYSFKEHIAKEVRIILDAYSNQKYSKLNILEKVDDIYVVQRNIEIPDYILLAAIFLFKEIEFPGATSLEVKDICYKDNSPGKIFIQDEHVLRKKIEELKKTGLISIESRGDLDQVRFKEGISYIDVLEKYYK